MFQEKKQALQRRRKIHAHDQRSELVLAPRGEDERSQQAEHRARQRQRRRLDRVHRHRARPAHRHARAAPDLIGPARRRQGNHNNRRDTYMY